MEGLLPHWLELRRRLLRYFVFFGLLSLPLLYCRNPLYTYLATPLFSHLSATGLIATQLITPFTIPIKGALLLTFLLSLPYLAYQLWQFIAPGLYGQEKRVVLPLCMGSVLLFYAGIAFAYWVALPLALFFFKQTIPQGVQWMIDIAAYWQFIVTLFLGCGLAFEIPLILCFLVKSGTLSLTALEQHRAYRIIGILTLSMLLTPPDVLSQIALALPLVGLVEGGLALARWLQKSS